MLFRSTSKVLFFDRDWGSQIWNETLRSQGVPRSQAQLQIEDFPVEVETEKWGLAALIVKKDFLQSVATQLAPKTGSGTAQKFVAALRVLP